MIAHSAHVMTLANSIIGVGILAMPFCFQKCGIILATILLIASNWITRICCHYLIKCSLLTRRKSFELLGFHAFGPSGKLLVELCIIGYLLGTCITYFVVVGDLGPQIVTKMLSLAGPHLHLRTVVMIAVTVVCILPLGMLKNVDSLSTVCTASIGFYFCFVIKIVLESEEHIVANDWPDKVMYWQPAGILQCLPIFSMALSCQMQLFEVFESINNQSLDKLNGIVRHSTWICTCVYVAVGFFGYVAFCTQSFSGNILVNFSESFGSDVIKVGFVLSVAFSFPLVIFPCRASIYSLLYRKGHADATGYIPESRFKAITIFIVGLALCVALMIPSVELIIGLVGSTIGVAICIMFPASCFRKIVRKDSTERMLAQFILISGFCLMILGTFANLNAIDAKRSGAHLDAAPVKENILMIPSAVPIAELKLDLDLNNLSETQKEEPIKLQDTGKSKAAFIKKSQLGLKTSENDKINAESQPAPPPLPVDEKHDAVEEEGKAGNLKESVFKTKTEDKRKPDLIKEQLVVPVEPNKVNVAAKNRTSASMLATARGINSEAIHKDDEIAAEERRRDKETKAETNEELRKTQNELQKTKELLQRTVGELKEELAKQSKKTENLVVEKLGEVVEKVKQIEQDVKQKESKELASSVADTKEARNEEALKADDQNMIDVRKNTSLLVGKLVEKPPHLDEVKPADVDKLPEALSNKADESAENARNLTKLEQRLSIPLPLLINASSSRLETKAESLAEKPAQKVTPKQELPEERKVEEEQPVKVDQEHRDPDDSNIAPQKKPVIIDSYKQNEVIQENVESIRRDLPQVGPKQLKNSISTDAIPLPAKEDKQIERFKRSSQHIDRDRLKLNDINAHMEQINSLPEIKPDTWLAAGSSNGIDFKIGGELKAIHEEISN